MTTTKFSDENVQSGWRKFGWLLQQEDTKNFVHEDDDGKMDGCFIEDAVYAKVFESEKEAQDYNKETFDGELIIRKIEVKMFLFYKEKTNV